MSARTTATTAVPGLVVVDKPAGITSHDVVSRVRRLVGTRKVGHAGTLDPMATGVLVLGVDRATRLLGHLLLTDKEYAARLRLGASSSTDDAEGELHDARPVRLAVDVTEDQVRSGLAAYVGEIDQVPTAVSAVKVDGRRAYERVRAGEEVELAARRVTVHSLDVHEVTAAEAPWGPAVDVAFTVRCSSGTYVRALARDLGRDLGTGGHLTSLRRTAVGPYDLAASRTLEQLGDDLASGGSYLPIADAARAAFPAVDLDDEQAADVRVGRRLHRDLGHDGPVALFAPDGAFLALYEQRGPGEAAAVAVFV